MKFLKAEISRILFPIAVLLLVFVLALNLNKIGNFLRKDNNLNEIDSDKQYNDYIEKQTRVENSVEKMIDGDVLRLESNCIKNNKQLTFSGDINTVGTLYFRRVADGWGSGYVAINSEKIEVYENFGEYKLRKSLKHGLLIKGETVINMFVESDDILHIDITSNS